ncbi:MAG: hypothetical protein RBT60_10415 [Candidatus Krumholzibacteria bacterium]|nr:hypothetical protein [Candidatus Krumholzibacteria bacterium]
MKSLKTTMALLLPLLMLGSVAIAGEKPDLEHGPTVYVPRVEEAGRALGDDCSDPIIIDSVPYSGTGFTTCGHGNNYADTCLGYYDGGEDIMFRLDIAEEVTIDIVMDPLGTGWTGILIDDECPPGAECIAINTGSSGVRTISGLTLSPGSYYIMVDTWPSPACIPEFNLTVDFGVPPPPPPTNDTCDNAIDLNEMGTEPFLVDLCAANNTYNAGASGASCTGYATNGNDVVYKIYLLAGQEFTASQQGAHDSAIWLATDCDDINGTCVIGADSTVGGGIETFTYTADVEGWYYLIVDGYSGCSVTTVWVTLPPIATENTNWSSVKAMYR